MSTSSIFFFFFVSCELSITFPNFSFMQTNEVVCVWNCDQCSHLRSCVYVWLVWLFVIRKWRMLTEQFVVSFLCWPTWELSIHIRIHFPTGCAKKRKRSHLFVNSRILNPFRREINPQTALRVAGRPHQQYCEWIIIQRASYVKYIGAAFICHIQYYYNISCMMVMIFMRRPYVCLDYDAPHPAYLLLFTLITNIYIYSELLIIFGRQEISRLCLLWQTCFSDRWRAKEKHCSRSGIPFVSHWNKLGLNWWMHKANH